MRVVTALVLATLLSIGLASAAPPSDDLERRRYGDTVQQALDDLDRHIAEARRRLGTMSDEARRRMDRHLDELGEQRRLLDRRLSDLRASTDAAWRELRSRLDAALDELWKTREPPPEEPELTRT